MKNISENKTTTNVEEIVNSAFREITSIGFFDIKKGNEPIKPVLNRHMYVIPNAMTKAIKNPKHKKDYGFGCCFVFSAYMMKILNDYNINNFMVASNEGNGIRASVMYEDNGQFYIANPVEDIEYFTKKHFYSKKTRAKYYEGNTSTMTINNKSHNDSRYTLDEFSQKYGDIYIIGSMSTNSNERLLDSINSRFNRQIMPPEKNNFNINQLLIKEKISNIK